MSRFLLLICLLVSATCAGQAAADDPLHEAETLLLAQRTRPDPAQFERAKQISAAAVERAPQDVHAWTVLAWVRMAEHRFTDALAAAKHAQNLAPDNARMLALMSDALVELGRYDEAVDVTQHLVDIAPGIPAWTRAAHLRFLFNDLDGAIQLMAMAARAGAAHGEPSAWTWLDLARLYLSAGNLAAANEAIAAAEQSYPGLAAALSAHARVRLAKGDAAAALDLYHRAIKVQPSAEDALAAWRVARQLKERGAEKHLAALLDGFAKLDRERSRRALAEYFAERGETGTALALAREELAARPDLYSEASLARVLHRAGNEPEARQHAQSALALNTPDPQLQTDMHRVLAPREVTAAKETLP